ncbi:MAG: PAS domain-containing protein [Pseudomonadota bacterium]
MQTADPLELLFLQSPHAVAIIRADGRIERVNGAFGAVFGCLPEEAAGRPIDSFLDTPIEPTAVTGDIRALLATEARCRRADGGAFHSRVSVRRTKGEEGDVGRYVATFFDIDRLAGVLSIVRAAAKGDDLNASALDALHRDTPVIMHSINADGRIEKVSEAWLDRFGYTREEVIGRSSSDFLDDESRRLAKRILPEFWRTGRCDRVPYGMIAKDGETVEVELSGLVTRIGDETLSVAVLEDVGVRNEALRSLRRSNDSLRTFARAAAHDLRGPLKNIAASAELLAEDMADGDLDGARAHAARIETMAMQLNGFVGALLHYSLDAERAPVQAMHRMDAVALSAVEALGPLPELAGASIRVAPMPEAACDRDLMEAVFRNLIENAIKYRHPDRPPVIEVAGQFLPETGAVAITVRDNGVGLAPEDAERAFEPLLRLSQRGDASEGYGLGLSLCRRILERHGGTIAISSCGLDTEGCEFILTVPRMPASEAHHAPDEVQRSAG